MKIRSFVLDEELLARLSLVLTTDEVRDLLILGLLEGRLVTLRTLTEESFLDKVDSCHVIWRDQSSRLDSGREVHYFKYLGQWASTVKNGESQVRMLKDLYLYRDRLPSSRFQVLHQQRH